LAPTELVALAASLGIEVLAITDHDTTEGVPAALAEARQQNITVVPGVEISALSGGEEIHLLGYFVNLENPDLQALLARARAARRERAQRMLERLAQLGLCIEWDRVIEIAGEGGSIGRPHVATTLLEAGHVDSWDEAFNLWIGRGCPAYVERLKLPPEEAIELVRASGGLPVLAHPFIYDRNGRRKAGHDLKRWLPRLRKAGLEGIEVYYPHYPRRANRQLIALAIQYGLLITGGSDFHGGMPGNGLGSVAIPWAVWEGLERRHRLMRDKADRPIQMRPKQASDLVPSQVAT
jgi:predicted metal-dependent phosphoesterase TrpH